MSSYRLYMRQMSNQFPIQVHKLNACNTTEKGSLVYRQKSEGVSAEASQ